MTLMLSEKGNPSSSTKMEVHISVSGLVVLEMDLESINGQMVPRIGEIGDLGQQKVSANLHTQMVTFTRETGKTAWHLERVFTTM